MGFALFGISRACRDGIVQMRFAAVFGPAGSRVPSWA